MLSRYIVAKHASQWMGYKGEPLSEQFQRYVLGSWLWRRGVVTVYGRWPDQPKQIVPFFTSMMTERQVEDAARVAAMKQLGSPIRILFAGRVEKVKGVDVLLRAAHLLAQGGLPFEITIVGDGSQCAALASLSEELGIAGSVRFEGAVPYDSMMPWYEYAHVLVLPSKHSEGWPKVLAEAMCHGVVCIGTDHGLVPWMLDGKGYVVPVDDVPALARCIERIAGEPDEYLRLSRNATLWARQYSLEALRTALRDLLSGRWQTAIGCRDAVSTGTGK
jgi:glycosyltransferase involved in cell wall biosynthesis